MAAKRRATKSDDESDLDNKIKELNSLDELNIEMLNYLVAKEKDYLSEIISGKVQLMLNFVLRSVKFINFFLYF